MASKFWAANKFKIVFTILALFIAFQIFRFIFWSHNHVNEKTIEENVNFKDPHVTITVFYEALCPDSKSFIIRQLQPVVKELFKYLTLILVPYGKAETHHATDGTISFSCQHGPKECEANKVHACVIRETSDKELLVNFIACMIEDNYMAEEAAKMCAQKLNVTVTDVFKCSRGREGTLLLERDGEITKALDPPVSFIPTVLLNEDRSNQAAVLKNLKKEVCTHLRNIPDECLS